MSPAARRLLRTIRSRRLIAPGDRVAVAVSGGADSVALWWLLVEIEATLPPVRAFSLAGLIHVHHGLRGADANQDEAFCRALAARCGQPIEVGRFDVAVLARERHRSIEATAREVRLAFFEEAAGRLGATSVATAHTADDQAETVLLRLLRGAGHRGVSGVRPRRGVLIRPLLESRREDLRSYLTARAEAWREDRSNDDVTVPRNRIRRDLLPVIERIWPSGVDALARFAATAADDEECLARRAIEASRSFVSWERGCARIDRRALVSLPPAIGRRVVRTALEAADPARSAGLQAIDAVRGAAAADTPSGRLDLPGVFVEWAGDGITIGPRASMSIQMPELPDVEFGVPGLVRLEAAGLILTARLADVDELAGGERGLQPANGRGRSVLVPRDALTLPLRVRGRRPGDRIRPMGSAGRRKVQDVLVDRKVPRRERDLVPIVLDATGRIVWVVGHALAEECRAPGSDRAVAGMVLLKVDALDRSVSP